jgi:hypothetical protein
MKNEEKQLIEYLESYSKLLTINAEYMKNLGELEEKNKNKFESFKNVMNNPEKLIELASKDSKKLSQTFIELIGIIATISTDKNPMELTPTEKKEHAKRLIEASMKTQELTKELKKIIKKSDNK